MKDIDVGKKQKELSQKHNLLSLLIRSSIYNSFDFSKYLRLKSAFSTPRRNSGFSIIELLVVITVIGILAGIATISYVGITDKVSEVTLKSDLSGSYITLLNYKRIHGSYPTALDINHCPTTPVADTEYCLTFSENNELTNYASDGTYMGLTANSSNGIEYHITDEGTPQVGVFIDPNWITIGTQTWAKYNLNIGIRIDDTSDQSEDGVVQKHCYNNLESNCNIYGGLYQWNEAMQYVTYEGAQGICPTGSHIPTDAEWTTLIDFLGSSTAGAQMKIGGGSGLDIPYGGFLDGFEGGEFYSIDNTAYLWSSSQDTDTLVWHRYIYLPWDTAPRTRDYKINSFSVRCIKD
jgi:uncharacterized protein (TIGR02145 family)/prepilin-type N-terminal cleavage/methylation domain-containing protein